MRIALRMVACIQAFWICKIQAYILIFIWGKHVIPTQSTRANNIRISKPFGPMINIFFSLYCIYLFAPKLWEKQSQNLSLQRPRKQTGLLYIYWGADKPKTTSAYFSENVCIYTFYSAESAFRCVCESAIRIRLSIGMRTNVGKLKTFEQPHCGGQSNERIQRTTLTKDETKNIDQKNSSKNS